MHGGETAEAVEICHIQREYMAYMVYAHGGSQSRIVHLNTQHTSAKSFVFHGHKL
jgi:hypothetical protein